MDLEDRDLIGIAQPGSGKMLVYLIPAILHVNSQPKRSGGGDGPIVLILAPTTQRAEQIQHMGAKFVVAYNIKVLCLYLLKHENSRGGILIDTLSSLLVLLKSKSTNLKSVTYLVLDGADWMLSDTHEPQIQNILSQIRLDCQKSLWGASWPEEAEDVTSKSCNSRSSALTSHYSLEDFTRLKKQCKEDDASTEPVVSHTSRLVGIATAPPCGTSSLVAPGRGIKRKN
ncbi:hypothetical protein ACFX2I_024674 [Malus domestica]